MHQREPRGGAATRDHQDRGRDRDPHQALPSRAIAAPGVRWDGRQHGRRPAVGGRGARGVPRGRRDTPRRRRRRWGVLPRAPRVVQPGRGRVVQPGQVRGPRRLAKSRRRGRLLERGILESGRQVVENGRRCLERVLEKGRGIPERRLGLRKWRCGLERRGGGRARCHERSPHSVNR
jgi:hypothetical protein